MSDRTERARRATKRRAALAARRKAKRRAALAIADAGDWDIEQVCAYFGGAKPLHPATAYRGVKAGRIPPPYHPTPGISRWVPDECRAAREAMIANGPAAEGWRCERSEASSLESA